MGQEKLSSMILHAKLAQVVNLTSWMLNQNDSNSANFTNFGGNDKVTSCEIY